MAHPRKPKGIDPVGALASRAAERAARESYGRLVAYLSTRSGDIASAEDALAEAFHRALVTWPRDGVPDNPDAWLLVAARRALGHVWRHRQVQADAVPHLADLIAEAESAMTTTANTAIRDQRLALMLVCAHPDIDPAAQTPLMLQTVLGLDAAQIASAFLVSPTAMAQRLVRAKARIKAIGVPFSIPEEGVPPERMTALLDAIYAAFGLGWADPDQQGGFALSEEAIWLGRVVVDAVPDHAEALGLLALMLFSHARATTRRGPDGNRFVPLEDQDTDRWDHGMIDAADQVLARAGALGRFGRYQCEAAIQAVHAERRTSGATRWSVLVTLYTALWRMTPTVGVAVGRAAALGRAIDPEQGLAALATLDPKRVATYQPFHATRAHLLARLADRQPYRRMEAQEAFRRAIGLTEDPAVRAYLIDQASRHAPDDRPGQG